MACGPVHSVALTNRGRLFACGFGDKYALGNGRSKSLSEFTEIKTKHAGKIEMITVGCSSTGFVSQGRIYVVGNIGNRTYETFTLLNCNEDIADFKITEKSVLILTRKGEVLQLGEHWKDGEKMFTENPKKIEKFPPVKQIFAGTNTFFALSENRGLFGWGDNSLGQVSAIGSKNLISTPQSLRLTLGNS